MPHETTRTIEGVCGRSLFVGIVGTSLNTQVSDLLARVKPGGIILFKRNVASLPDLVALCSDLRRAVDPPPLLAIDEEGGRVTRLTPHVTGLPPASITASQPAERLREYWRRYGDLLALLGIDIDFAPVVDLCSPDAVNGIADRSYGTDPQLVAGCGSAAIEGLMEAGVLPTLKHFPGLGNTLLDSHDHLPSIQKDREAFEREDLFPFIALASRSPAVMVGHGHYPFYAGPDARAATLSSEICTDLLRRRIGFGGTAISDDLEMKAVAARVAWEDLAPRTIESGCDMILICHQTERILAAHEAIVKRARSDARFSARCEEAARRVDALRRLAWAARARAHTSRGKTAAGEILVDRLDRARASLMQAAGEMGEARA